MNTKQELLQRFIKDYLGLQGKIEELQQIQSGLKENNIEFFGELRVEGKSFYLQNLIEGSTNTLYHDFQEPIADYITYLLQLHQNKMQSLLDSIEFVETTNNSNNPSNVSPNDSIEDILKEYKEGTILSPNEIYEKLPSSIQETYTLSKIHDIFSEYVEQEKMQTLYYTPCYKCNNGYHRYYEYLPRNIICEECREDIVNIEIHYKKLY